MARQSTPNSWCSRLFYISYPQPPCGYKTGFSSKVDYFRFARHMMEETHQEGWTRSWMKIVSTTPEHAI
jgi:hypothetical protein